MSTIFAWFGGTFDPVHKGHVAIAMAVRQQLAPRQFFLLPTGQSPHKPNRPPTPAALRLAMLKAAFAGLVGVEISELEVHSNRICYTVETVSVINREFPGVRHFWVIGADQLESLPQWHRFNELQEIVDFAVVARPGFDTAIPGGIKPSAIHFVEAPFVDVSSTAIRRLRANKQPISDLVPSAVESIIVENGLYIQ